MLDELYGVAKIYLVSGYTDMRRSIDGLMAIVRYIYELDPIHIAIPYSCSVENDATDRRPCILIKMDLSSIISALIQEGFNGHGIRMK